jgi:hypothetical protein
MEKPVFPDKNLLVLYPTDDNGYKGRFAPLQPHFKSVHYFEYTSGCASLGLGAAERRIEALVSGEKIDIVLCCLFASDHQLSVEFLSSLGTKAKLVFWFADDSTYFEVYDRYYAQIADAVLSSDGFAVQAYKRLEIPAVFCPEVVITNKLEPVKAEQDIDVSFIGDMTKRGRKEYVEFLRDNGIKPVVFGAGSGNGYLPFDKISEYFCRSRINLNFTQIGELNWITADEPLLNRVRQNTGRPREIALAGAFCLSEYSPSLEDSFKIGEELDVFRDKAELLEKVRYYLANPARRDALAAAARARADGNYRIPIYIARALEAVAGMLAAGRARRTGAAALYLSPAFKAKAVNSLTFNTYALLLHGRLPAAAAMLPRLLRYGPAAFLRGFAGGSARALRLAAARVLGASVSSR